jgi:hypothetical protein
MSPRVTIVQHPLMFSSMPWDDQRNFQLYFQNWLDRQASWRDARQRFFEVHSKGRNYDIDRLIGAANMFDILPSSAVSSDVPLSIEMLEAKAEARRIFKKLGASPERDSVLATLGRLGKANLKQKVRSRAQLVLKAMPGQFSDFTSVIDQAVDCRNYFVHGGDPRMSYSENPQIVWFFADTLEFVFAASDLIEAGWDIGAWSARTSVSHPFGLYIRNYRWRMASFQTNARKVDAT